MSSRKQAFLEALDWLDAYTADIGNKVQTTFDIRRRKGYEGPPLFSWKNFNRDFNLLKHSEIFNDAMHQQDYLEFIYVFEGECLFYTNTGYQVLAKQGACILVGNNLLHCEHVDIKKSRVYHLEIRNDMVMRSFVHLLSDSPLFASFFNRFLLDPGGQHYLVLPSTGRESSPAVTYLLQSIIMEFAQKKPHYIEIIESMIASLFLHISRDYWMNSEKVDQTPDVVQKVLEYMYTNFADASLKSTADHFNYQPDYLSRMLKKQYGKSFQEILSSYRLIQSRRLLSDSNLSVQDISSLVGYTSPGGFIKAFKKQYGETPSQYRQDQTP